MSERYSLYRDRLLKAGFSEATDRAGHFFRQATEKTAFVINLHDDEDNFSVMYGFASTAFMAGDEETFAKYGSFDNDCRVRNILLLHDGNEADAAKTITDFYKRYKDYSKDGILALKKERQKAFLDHFAKVFKPLGFKKKGPKWTKDLGDGTALEFYAQKSAFSDEYYFNVTIYDLSDPDNFELHKYERVVMNGSALYNWQLMTEEQTEELIQCALDDYIYPIITK